MKSAEETDAFMRGVAAVTVIRCSEHYAIPAYNHNESGGGECAACAVEELRGTLEVEREASRLARAKAEFQRDRADAAERDAIEISKRNHVLFQVAQSVVYVSENRGTNAQFVLRGLVDDARAAIAMTLVPPDRANRSYPQPSAKEERADGLTQESE